jgi:hypothetical protein
MKPGLGSQMDRACRTWDKAWEGLMLCSCIKYAMTTVADRDLPMALEKRMWLAYCYVWVAQVKAESGEEAVWDWGKNCGRGKASDGKEGKERQALQSTDAGHDACGGWCICSVLQRTQRQGTGAGGSREDGKAAKQGSRGRRSRVVWVDEASARQGYLLNLPVH